MKIYIQIPGQTGAITKEYSDVPRVGEIIKLDQWHKVTDVIHHIDDGFPTVLCTAGTPQPPTNPVN